MDSIFAIVGIFFLPIVMVILVVWFKSVENRKRYQFQAELCAKAIEKGQSMPENLFIQPKKKVNPLNTGIICIAIGLGLSIFLWLVVAPYEEAKAAAAVGIIPFFIGIAYLIIYYIEKKQSESKNAQ